jgi:hypothetical protein
MDGKLMRRFLFTLLIFLFLTSNAHATWTTFDVIDDLFTVTQFAGININTFTFMCHANNTGAGENSGGRIADKSNSATLDTEGWNYNTFNATGNLNLNVYNNGSGGAGIGIWSTPVITYPAHVAISHNGSSTANDPSFYTNAVLLTETQNSAPSAVMTIGAHNLAIGNRLAGDRTWAGQLGDCAMFTGELSSNAILQSQHYGPAFVIGNICYWPLGSFSGRSHGGTGGSSCNATATGSPVASETGPRRSSPQGGFIFLGS